VLRGAGVALALPWLESLVRPASAQVPATAKRFVAIYMPNGAPEVWWPPVAGAGSAWQLSSALEPLAPLKPKLTVISGLENGTAFNADGSPSVEPSNGRSMGGWLTCTDAQAVRKKLGLPDNADVNGVSLDQVMAADPVFTQKTMLPSLQIGLSMLEDSRSDFVYDNVPRRTFSALTSTPSIGVCPDWYIGGLNGLPDDYASIVYWHIAKVSAFCQRLDGMIEENGRSVLDNSVVYLGSGIHGSDHAADRLPAFFVGSGGGLLKTDQHLALTKRPLRDFYFTLMSGVYGMGATDFGVNLTGAPIAPISQLLQGAG
jgi:hypothetical protein